jgi:hypothetical protein
MVLTLGVILAVVLSGAITVAGYSVLQDASLRSRQVNRAVVSDGTYLQPIYINGTFADYSNTSFACNVTAATVIPRYVVVGAGDFNLNVLFTVVVAPNVSFASGDNAGWEPGEGWVSAWFFYDNNGWGEYGAYPSYPTLTVNGTGLGGTGVGVWNVTVRMCLLLNPPPPVLLNQSDWLSFTTQADDYLFVEFHGYAHFVNGNGSENSYFATAFFPPKGKGSPITFITFGYPIAALLGYGASVLVAVVSLYLLRRFRVKTVRQKKQ